MLSASPELFFELRDGAIVTRPMKGTAPRGRWPEEDRAAAERLLASAKDRAENAMIVDLLRNDLGRISRTGSVTWADVFLAERYETVWQLTTTVSSVLERGVDLAGVFRGLFPSGSVTGAPKVRTMQIISELEDSPRGVYCGAVGYLAPAGSGHPDARFNVAIRTVTVDTVSGTAEYGVGGGITWDSDAEGEFEETVAKARVLTARRPGFELLETMRHDAAEGVRHLDLHLRRLSGSADYFGFRYDETEVREAIEKAVASVPSTPCRVRLSLAKDGATRVVCTPVASGSDVVRVALDDVPQDPRDVFLFHKTSRRQRYEDARRRHPDADDVVLVNDRGEVTESTIANVAVRLGGGWVTPPLEAGLLPGIGRAVALEDGSLSEDPISIEELRSADEIALVSDARGWRRAVARLVPLGLHREGERPHPVLFQGAVTQGAARGLLVHEHGPLAVRAIPFSHRGVVRFRSASASRSGGAVSCMHRRNLAYLESGRRQPGDGRARGPDRERPSPFEEGRWGGGAMDARRLPSPCGCGACRVRRTCGPVRAASSSPTCCRSKASSLHPGAAQLRSA